MEKEGTFCHSLTNKDLDFAIKLAMCGYVKVLSHQVSLKLEDTYDSLTSVFGRDGMKLPDNWRIETIGERKITFKILKP